MWGSTEKHHRFLQKFVDQFGDFATRLDAAAAASDADRAALVHKLRGAAANIGLEWLADTARTLELQLKQEQDCSAALEAFRLALSATLAHIAATVTGDEAVPSHPQPTPAVLQPLFEQIRVALQKDTPDDVEPLLAQLRSQVPEEPLKTLTDAVSRYDFRGAERALSALAQACGLIDGGR